MRAGLVCVVGERPGYAITGRPSDAYPKAPATCTSAATRLEDVLAEWPLEPALCTVTIWNDDQEVEMSSLTRHVVRPTAVTLSILFVVGTAFLASAQLLPMADPDICATPGVGAEASFLVENDAAMRKMMNDMEVKPTGDVDADFVAMMIPHHQGAIDMARAELRYGHNEKLARIAQEIIVTQQQEIAAMRLSVGEPLASSRASPDQQDPRTASRSNLNKWFTQEP